MTIVKVLKRRDAASVIVAVVVALILVQLLSATTGELANKISGLKQNRYPGMDWKTTYLLPVVSAVLQLVVLELVAWVYGALHAGMTKKS
ncbi:MAG TPA: hypothetical protein VLG37_04730 [Candidatus Saccharimonadales bacterium]|nr:hypothetical protein [Candidatus Saccharimonadales bacterium]